MSASPFVGQLPHNSSGMSHSKWVLDSSTSHHMSPDSSSFTSMSPSPSIPVMTVDGTPMPLAGLVLLSHLTCLSLMFILF